MKALLLLTLAACAAEPTTQPTPRICLTCDKGVTYQQARDESRTWVTDSYANANILGIDCTETIAPEHGWSCAFEFSWGGQNYIAGCDVSDDLSVDCGIDEAD